jgi:hypothetical protein
MGVRGDFASACDERGSERSGGRQTMSDTAKIVGVAALTTYEVEPHSARVHLSFRQSNGAPATLVLSVDCLSQLLMTIPRMISAALRETRGHEAARLVHPLVSHRLELADQRSQGAQQFILTLETAESFAVSFCASADSLTCLAHSIVGDLGTSPVVDQKRKILS